MICKHNLGPIMLCFGRSALRLKRGTTCSLSFILPLWGLGHNKLESFDFGAKRKRRKSPDRFSLTALLRRLVRLRGAYKPCRRSCGRLALTQFRRFPLKNNSRTHDLPGERVLDREPMHSHTRTHDLRYFREAGNKEKSPNHV